MKPLRTFVAITIIFLHLFWWVVLSLPLYALRFFNLSLYRQIEPKFFAMQAYLLMYVIEEAAHIKFVFSGDKFPGLAYPAYPHSPSSSSSSTSSPASEAERNVIVMSNHISDVDGFLLFLMAMRYNMHGFVRFYLKQIIKFVFPAGLILTNHENFFLARTYAEDQKNIRTSIDSFKSTHSSIWLNFFPEGTFVTPKRIATLEENRKFAEDNNLPKLKYLLVPRYKGLCLALKAREYFSAVYDVTLAFSKPFEQELGNSNPTNFLAHLNDELHTLNPTSTPLNTEEKRQEVHVHCRRIPIDQFPHSDDEVRTWLMKHFEGKEQLLDNFAKTQSFPGESYTVPIPDWNIKLLLTLIPPSLTWLFTSYLLVCLLGWAPALKLFGGASLLLFVCVSAIVIFFIKQGGKKKTSSSKKQDSESEKVKAQ